MRILTEEKVREEPLYSDLVPLSRIFNHPIVEDGSGTWRWMPNPIMSYLKEPKWFKPVWGGPSYAINLDDLNSAWHRGEFSLEAYMKFQMDQGYSLGGFCEIFESRKDVKTGLSLIELVIANHARPENQGKHWAHVSTAWKMEPWGDGLSDEDFK